MQAKSTAECSTEHSAVLLTYMRRLSVCVAVLDMFDCNKFIIALCLPFITNLSVCKITLATELLVRCDLNHFAIMVQRCAPTGPSYMVNVTSNMLTETCLSSISNLSVC